MVTKTDKIFIQIGNERQEAKGEVLQQILKDQADYAEQQRLIEAEQQAKEAARQSAIDKLKKLGLNEEEIAALVP
jgi:multidrug efflux pump subunit AcrA (membrane-fusion protein)